MAWRLWYYRSPYPSVQLLLQGLWGAWALAFRTFGVPVGSSGYSSGAC